MYSRVVCAFFVLLDGVWRAGNDQAAITTKVQTIAASFLMPTTSLGRLPRSLAQPRNTIKRLAYRELAGPVYYDAVFEIKKDPLDSS